MNSINGMASAYSAYNTAMANKVSKNVKTTETEKTTELTEAEKLEAFKKEIWNEINSMPRNPHENNSIHITDGAFKRMMDEPEFKEQMMSLLREDGRVSLQHYSLFTQSSAITNITEDGYSGFGWFEGYPNAPSFDDHAKDAFWVQRGSKKSSNVKSSQEIAKKQKTLDQIMLERALETKANNEKHLKDILENGSRIAGISTPETKIESYITNSQFSPSLLDF